MTSFFAFNVFLSKFRRSTHTNEAGYDDQHVTRSLNTLLTINSTCPAEIERTNRLYGHFSYVHSSERARAFRDFYEGVQRNLYSDMCQYRAFCTPDRFAVFAQYQNQIELGTTPIPQEEAEHLEKAAKDTYCFNGCQFSLESSFSGSFFEFPGNLWLGQSEESYNATRSIPTLVVFIPDSRLFGRNDCSPAFGRNGKRAVGFVVLRNTLGRPLKYGTLNFASDVFDVTDRFTYPYDTSRCMDDTVVVAFYDTALFGYVCSQVLEHGVALDV